MKILIVITLGTAILLSQKKLVANIYEGFDMSAPNASLLGSSNSTLFGESSIGWHSSWQSSKGKVLFINDDLEIQAYTSSTGAIIAKGERKENSIGQSIAIRQINTGFEGDIFGSFRFRSGNLIKDSVLGILFSIPSAESSTPRNALFSFCPKRWGSAYGMLSAGSNYTSKIENGIECYPDDTYLVIWKLENLPAAGKRASIGLKMWVLDSRQATYFAENSITEKNLQSAKLGSNPQNINQRAEMSLANSRRGIFKGLIISCFSNGLARVCFDEIRVSKNGLASAVGLKEEKY